MPALPKLPPVKSLQKSEWVKLAKNHNAYSREALKVSPSRANRKQLRAGVGRKMAIAAGIIAVTGVAGYVGYVRRSVDGVSAADTKLERPVMVIEGMMKDAEFELFMPHIKYLGVRDGPKRVVTASKDLELLNDLFNEIGRLKEEKVKPDNDFGIKWVKRLKHLLRAGDKISALTRVGSLFRHRNAKRAAIKSGDSVAELQYRESGDDDARKLIAIYTRVLLRIESVVETYLRG